MLGWLGTNTLPPAQQPKHGRGIEHPVCTADEPQSCNPLPGRAPCCRQIWVGIKKDPSYKVRCQIWATNFKPRLKPERNLPHSEWSSCFPSSDRQPGVDLAPAWSAEFRFNLNKGRNTSSKRVRVECTQNKETEAIYCDRWLYTDPGFIMPYYIPLSLFLKISLILL